MFDWLIMYVIFNTKVLPHSQIQHSYGENVIHDSNMLTISQTVITLSITIYASV